MRVLLDAHQVGHNQTGNETYVRELLPLLCSKEGLRITAAVDNADGRKLALTVGAVPYGVSRNGGLRLAALAFAAWRLDADLLHSIYYLPPGIRRPTVVTIHDISFELHPEFFSRADLVRNRTLIRRAARHASVVVTVSETSRRDIIEHYSVDPARVITIHNGVSSVFSPGAVPRRLTPGGPFRILAVGTLQPRKNLLRLLDAVRLVAKTRDVSLKIIGPDGYQADCIRARLGQVTWAQTAGYLRRSELVAAYREADLFVYPSIYEGFGLPVIEAMASGTPVVASTGGSLPEIAGDAALLVDPLDVDALARAISRVADSETLRDGLRARGLMRAKAFSWAHAADQHLSAYAAAVLGR